MAKNCKQIWNGEEIMSEERDRFKLSKDEFIEIFKSSDLIEVLVEKDSLNGIYDLVVKYKVLSDEVHILYQDLRSGDKDEDSRKRFQLTERVLEECQYFYVGGYNSGDKKVIISILSGTKEYNKSSNNSSLWFSWEDFKRTYDNGINIWKQKSSKVDNLIVGGCTDSNITFLHNAIISRALDVDSKVDDNKSNDNIEKLSLQTIYYGAPGTGKSHKIKEKLAGVSKENIFRTTFHPDSDYSTFVGAYKPSTDKPEDKLYNKEELISKLTELKEQGVTYAPQKFGAQFWYSLKQLTLQDKKDILAACEMSDKYTVEFDKGIAVGEELLKKAKESRIIYKFIPQAFLTAYMRAYSTTDKVYLIIEEINRGNCAQIFGDLFQLLDRDENGVSEYCIKADADLRAYLEEELGADSDAIKDGELCLPSNLYIYATMNTSDQSLFPIDSAFKRRWDWEYEPIKYKNINWVIDIEGSKYLWTSFQREINKRIFDATNSEDKMLGDYFVNPADGVITEKILLNKILFYLWNDVCKDGEGDIFKTADNEDVTFSDLHSDGGKDKLIAMMKYLKVEEA